MVVVDPLSALGLAAEAITALRKRLREKVVLQPEKLSFGGSEWQQVWNLTLSSLSEVPLYDVVVGIWSDDRPVLPELPIELVQLDGEPTGPMVKTGGGLTRDVNSSVLRGRAGVHGVMLVFIRQINPHQVISLGLRSNQHGRFHVFTEVLEYSDKQTGPLYVTRADGTVLTRIRLPIDMSISGMGFYIGHAQ